MELETIKQSLNLIRNALLSKAITIDCYLFGSILISSKQANDIDVLIIYKSESQLRIIKKEFTTFASLFPLHFSYFTFFEEKELNFVKEQKAEIIFSI